MVDLNVAPSSVNMQGLWFRWVLANIVGMSVGFFLSKAAFDNLWILAVLVAPFALAGPVAILQWLILRSQISLGWVWVTIIGMALGFFISGILSSIPVLPYIVFGLTMGAAQWLVLQSRFLQATSWIWANTLGMGILGIAQTLADAAGVTTPNNVNETLMGIIVAVVAGALFGGITGISLVRLLQRPKPQV